MAEPDTIADLDAWWKADAITGLADGAAVSSWADSSGNGWTASQDNASYQPKWWSGVLNGRPVVRFDGGDSFISSLSGSPTARTVFAVAKNTTANQSTMLGSAGGTGGNQYRFVNSKQNWLKQSTAAIGTATNAVNTTSFYVATGSVTTGSDGTWAFHLDGADNGSGTHAQTFTGGRTTYIGAGHSGLQEFYSGDLAELIVYNRVLTAGERATVHSYLSDRYGITVADYTGSGTTGALSGAGTLTVASTLAVTRAAGLSGAGTLTVASTLAVTRAAGLSGSGSLTAVPTPAVVSTDFTGADGAAWPPPWTTTSGTATIQSNRGQQATAAAQWSDCSSEANVNVADGRATATARFPALAGRSLRIDVRFDPATGNGYRVICPGDYDGFQLVRVDAWTETELDADWTVTWAAATDYRVAFDFDGGTLRAKRWPAGDAEPSTWQIEATDATYTTGDVRLVTVTSQAASATGLWDDVIITEVAAVVPPAMTNPERGWFHYTETHWLSDDTGHVALTRSALETERTTNGRTLVFRYYVMEKYRTVDTIDQAYKDAVAADITAARAAGVKLIPRFAYSTSGDTTAPYDADAPAARVVSHIGQLAPVLNAGADVIDALQAGFIGMWGEWYYTDNFGDLGTLTAQNWADRKAVVDALLDNLDARIFVLLRYVGIKRRLLDENPSDTRYSGGRLGFHNDAFLASSDDWGTYTTFTSYTEAQNRTWLLGHNQTGRYPQGGETGGVNEPRSLYPSAKQELSDYRWTFLNPQYHADVLTSWGQTGRDEVSSRLGYRPRLVSASVPATATTSGTVSVSIDIANDGWAAPYRARPWRVVFVDGATVVTRDLPGDFRDLAPGATTTISGSVAAPGTAGTYSVHLLLPDASASLQGDALFAVRLDGATFDAATGRNALAATTTVTASGAAALSGSGTLTAGSTPAVSLPGALSGAGTLTASIAAVRTAAAALSGAGALTAASRPAVLLPAALSGSGSLSATGAGAGIAPAALSGAGNLSAGSTPAWGAAAGLSGSGSLSAASAPAFTRAAGLSGSGSLTAASSPAQTSGAGLSGAGALTTSAAAARAAPAALSGAGSLSATGAGAGTAPAALSGAGSLTAAAVAARAAPAALTGGGTLSATGAGAATVPAALSGAGALAAAATRAAAATLAGSGALTVSTAAARAAPAALSGAGSLSATGRPAAAGLAALSGAGTLAATTAAALSAAANLTGAGDLAAVAYIVRGLTIVFGAGRSRVLTGAGRSRVLTAQPREEEE